MPPKTLFSTLRDAEKNWMTNVLAISLAYLLVLVVVVVVFSAFWLRRRRKQGDVRNHHLLESYVKEKQPDYDMSRRVM